MVLAAGIYFLVVSDGSPPAVQEAAIESGEEPMEADHAFDARPSSEESESPDAIADEPDTEGMIDLVERRERPAFGTAKIKGSVTPEEIEMPENITIALYRVGW